MRLVRLTAAAVAGVAVLAGCSGGETANETLPSTSSSAAETTASLPPLGPPDLPMPDEARQKSPQGAQSFAQYYVALINRLESDLDPEPLRTLSRSCDTCDRIAKDADSDKAAGYSYTGGTLTLTSIGEATVTADTAELAFVFDQAPLVVIDRNGSSIPDLSSPLLSGLPGGLSLTWAADHWFVSSLSFG